MANDASVDYDTGDEVLSLTGTDFLLLIHITPSELASLVGVSDAEWGDRESIRAGEVLGYPVFWCRGAEDPKSVSILVGPDDETWAVAAEFPADVLLRALPK